MSTNYYDDMFFFVGSIENMLRLQLIFPARKLHLGDFQSFPVAIFDCRRLLVIFSWVCWSLVWTQEALEVWAMHNLRLHIQAEACDAAQRGRKSGGFLLHIHSYSYHLVPSYDSYSQFVPETCKSEHYKRSFLAISWGQYAKNEIPTFDVWIHYLSK